MMMRIVMVCVMEYGWEGHEWIVVKTCTRNIDVSEKDMRMRVCRYSNDYDVTWCMVDITEGACDDGMQGDECR